MHFQHVPDHEQPRLKVLRHPAGALQADGRPLPAHEAEEGVRVDAPDARGAVEAGTEQSDESLAEVLERPDCRAR